MTVITRQAIPADGQALCDLLNPLIRAKIGTALRKEFDVEGMIAHYIDPSVKVSCAVASVDDQILGFQSLVWPRTDAEKDRLAPGWAIIATFVGMDAGRRGIGSALFKATVQKAKDAGVQTIDASIDSKNESGLKYYSAIGFLDYDHRPGLTYSTGGSYDQICKRFDLKDT